MNNWNKSETGKITAALRNGLLVGDGAMGTMIQQAGLADGRLPESLNHTHPQQIQEIHGQYLEAGSDFVSTNTFGANRLKLEKAGLSVTETVRAAVGIARAAVSVFGGAGSGQEKYVALDIGPSGRLPRPLGDLGFEEGYALFAEQILAGSEAGADFILLETFTDIMEMKIAVLAAKENSSLPVFCSLSFQEDGRMLSGTDPATAVHLLQDMGIQAIGANCSLGPAQMVPLIREMLSVARIPVLVQPNAGMPRMENGNTVFDVDARAFASETVRMVRDGVSVIGGCCGTGPDYIETLVESIKQIGDERVKAPYEAVSAVPGACSVSQTAVIGDRVTVIGERLNPTGKKRLAQALREGDMVYVEDEALKQAQAGAHIINVNAGLPDVDERALLTASVDCISQVTDLPLMIDCTTPEIIETVLRTCRGKPIVNSVNGEQKRMDEIFPLVAKYGTAVVALTLDERGIPRTARARLEILEKIIREAERWGIDRGRLLVDFLTLTVSAQPEACQETLQAIRMAKERYGIRTTLGVSNISFGLPDRRLLNRTFLAMALSAGLDAPIIDPTSESYMETVRGVEVLLNRDRDAADYISFFQRSQETAPLSGAGGAGMENPALQHSAVPSVAADPDAQAASALQDIILKGQERRAGAAAEALIRYREPLTVIEGVILPALETVGRQYEAGEIFLPQMVRAADTVKNAFAVVRRAMAEKGEAVSWGKVILATVRDDIHDIGKNIVKAIMENYGYEVVDLGKNVPPEQIVETAIRENIRLVGLSALMTTTVIHMEETIRQLRAAGLTCGVAVGGAVLNPAYAAKIGADYYCKNAMDTVHAANEVFRGTDGDSNRK